MMTNYIGIVTVILTIIGALNCGLVGIAELDWVAYFFGSLSTFSRVIYGLVGLLGVYLIISIKKLIS